jgi:Tol biopolymer transport system component/DNA-binding winged helix-turn-helix (wHTH) protein
MGKELPGGGVSSAGTLRFGPFEFDVRAGELTRHGSKIRLQEQPFQILRMLLARPGDIVLREEIRQHLWPNDTVVEFDHSINAAIKRLRDALGDSAENPCYVETVARRGYRFIGSLDGVPAPQLRVICPERTDESPPDLTLLGSDANRKLIPRQIRIAATAIAVTSGAVLLYFSFSRQPPPDIPRLRFSIEAPEDTAFTNIYGGAAISPDGRLLVFTALRSRALSSTLWLRATDSLAARELPETQGAATAFWSPDSRWIAFFAEGKLKKIQVSGGLPQTLCDASVLTDWDNGSWSHEGIIVFSSVGTLHRVAATGGLPVALTKLDASRQETLHGSPQFLPDGRHLLLLIGSRDQNTAGLYETSLDRPEERVRIVGTDVKAAYVPPQTGRPGCLLWVRERTLLVQPFNANGLRLSGNPLPLAENIAISSNGTAAFWASDTGLLLYRSGSAVKHRMTWIGRHGASLEQVGKEGVYGVPRISPDGSRVALRARTDSGNTDVWAYQFGNGTMTRLTFDPGVETFPVWSPDGRKLAFECDRQLCRSNANGAGPVERLTYGPNAKYLWDWRGDGRYLLYAEGDPPSRGVFWILPLANDRRPTPFLRTKFHEFYGQFSPDGKWIAYTSDESGREEVYIRSFSASGGWRQISNSGGTQPRWRRDGRELFYLAGGNMMAASIRTKAEGIESESPHVVFPVPGLSGTFYSYDVAADGNRFLVLQPVGGSGAGALTMLSSW